MIFIKLSMFSKAIFMPHYKDTNKLSELIVHLEKKIIELLKFVY
jgi:hypothetical protein